MEEVAALLGQHSAPQFLTALSNSDVHTLTEQLVKQIEFQFGMGDETDGRISFAAHAYARLAEHGVAASDLGNAFNALKTALIPQREFTCSDVHEILKSFIGGAAIGIFDGRAQALTDELLATRANGKRIQQYYAGAPLDWDIIAAHGDIPRDQQVALIAKLLQPTDSLRLFCIVAEPGAGKSTLAWRVASKLHRRHGAFVIRLRDGEEPECWYQMEEFYQRVNRPFYVLADDLFRSPDVVSALCELSPSLPITVLATSRKNEYRLPRFKSELVREDLKQPSKEEKERVLERLGKSRNELTAKQQSRLDGANQFLVLMMELTAGKELSEIVRDTVERLKEQDQSAYRAYEYLCFAYQHSVSMPESLLERLDDQGRFHRLPARETTQGLIFYDDERGGHVRVGHPVIAQTATAFYQALRSPIAVLRESVKAVNLTIELERRFVACLLRAQAKSQSTALQLVFQEIEAFFTKLQQDARIGELTIWRGFFRLLGHERQSEQCVDLALTRPAADSNDCNLLINLYRERGREGDALPLLAEWIRQNPDSRGARPGYLSLVERNCKEDEIGAAINETAAWLTDHPQDYSVRGKYLGLVERKGTGEQVNQVVVETSAWLTDHSQDNFVRTAYVGLVERKGTAEQVKRVVAETSAWLKSHPEDYSVRGKHVGLVERKGTGEQVKQVVAETSAWVTEHPEGNFVRTAYLGLVERKGTGEQVKRVVAETSAWLKGHPQDYSVRGKYVGLVGRKGTGEQVKQVVVETSAWLTDHPEDNSVRTAYLGLVECKGTGEQVKGRRRNQRLAHRSSRGQLCPHCLSRSGRAQRHWRAGQAGRRRNQPLARSTS